MDYTILRDEIVNDPEALGYAGKTDPEVAALMNEIGGSGEKIDRDFIDGQEMMSVVVIGEYVALSDVQRVGWSAIISAGTGMVDVNNAGTIAQVTAIWVGTTTLANLVALRQRDASRAEVLFGQSVSHLDVGKARVI